MQIVEDSWCLWKEIRKVRMEEPWRDKLLFPSEEFSKMGLACGFRMECLSFTVIFVAEIRVQFVEDDGRAATIVHLREREA